MAGLKRLLHAPQLAVSSHEAAPQCRRVRVERVPFVARDFRQRCGTGLQSGQQLLPRAVRLGPPVDVFQTPQRGGDLAIVQPQRQEAAVVIAGIAERGRVPFQPHPLGLERGFGHAQHQHARPLQSLLDRRDDVLATV